MRFCFPRKRFFFVAGDNFLAVASYLGAEDWLGVLMLSEIANEAVFPDLRAAAGLPGHAALLSDWGGWLAERTKEDFSLLLRHEERRLLVVAGRQIDTHEGLEVCLLGTTASIANHSHIEDVLDEGCRLNALVVIPWAPGKWWFRRRRILNTLLERREHWMFFLGDNGGRTWLWPTPHHLRRARREGQAIVSGSDPLPIADELRRIGSFGVVVELVMDWSHPGEHIKSALRNPKVEKTTYGKLDEPVAFLRREMAMQITKKKRKNFIAGSI
jgi:hypothetical protein